MMVTQLQVFNLTEVKTGEFVRYGLVCLEKFAAKGDEWERERKMLKIIVSNIHLQPLAMGIGFFKLVAMTILIGGMW